MSSPNAIAQRRAQEAQTRRPQPPEPPEMPVSPRVKLLAQWLRINPQPGLSAAEIAALLNAPGQTPNPQPQQIVPRPLTILEAFAVVRPAEALAIYQAGTLKNDIEAALLANDRRAITALFAVASELLTPESRKALAKLLAENVPDPAWQPTVTTPSIAQQIGVGRATPVEVVQAQELAAKV